MRRLFLNWVYSKIDFALYVGINNKNYYYKHGLKDRQLILAPHAIDNERFGNPDNTYKQQAEEWRQKMGIAKNNVVLLFAGKLEPIKNPFFILEIAKQVSSNEFNILFVGNGVLEASLIEAAANDHRIMFMDFQNQMNMPVVYRMADVLILPSHSETWGLAVNEAMASGCAVMMSDRTGGAVDLIQEGKNGIIFNASDTKKCVEFINHLLAHRNELENMKQASRDIITNFSFERIVLAIEQLIKNTGSKA
jgi:glycosyltransferase involved in cell wall biosynthesis